MTTTDRPPTVPPPALGAGEPPLGTHLGDGDVAAVVAAVWQVVLGAELRPAGAGSLGAATRWLTGFVLVQGAWDGAVCLEVPAELAADAAAAMYGTDVDTLGGDDIDDALGELANMVGGGVKALLPGPSQLSLPTVVGGLDYELNVPHSRALRQLWFLDERDRAVTVTVLEAAPDLDGRVAGTRAASEGRTDGSDAGTVAGGEQRA